MAWAYHIYRVDPDSEIIRVEHVFYGYTKAECLDEYHAHLAACTGLHAAEHEDRIEDEWESLYEDELPTSTIGMDGVEVEDDEDEEEED